jgi:hypothetical protein
MRARVTSGLFRLWVVFSLLWFAAVGAYTVVSYQNVSQHDLVNGRPAFDDLIPAYAHCWSSWSSNDEDWVRIEDLPPVAECERLVDRWQIIRNDTLIALCIPIIVLGLGWAFRNLWSH